MSDSDTVEIRSIDGGYISFNLLPEHLKNIKLDGNGAWSVMCCGCQRMMASNGEAVETKPAATFDTKEQADATAKLNGWQIRDAQGPNHRCPKCQQKEKFEATKRRGAYVKVR